MWNYVYFIAYLDEKSETEYTGIESNIHFKIKNHDYSWFPINKLKSHPILIITFLYISALSLKDFEEEDDEEKKFVQKLNSMNNHVKIIYQNEILYIYR
jgi:hypothetical protein